MQKEAIKLTTHSGYVLAATLFKPEGKPRSSIVVGSALGVSQTFYLHFANWLCARGHLVMTFDLCGMGASRALLPRASLKGLKADMLSWARDDFSVAVETLSSKSQGEPLIVVGHSLGAHHAAMSTAQTQSRIAKLVLVAAGSGCWQDWAAPSRRFALWMLKVAVPMLTPLFGYFPGKRLRMVGDLPKPAALQWARWCCHPQFAWGSQPQLVWPSLQSANFPIEAFSFTDDEAMTKACTQHFLAALPHAPSRLQVISPEEVGLKAIGHLGVFRRASEPLWHRLAEAIEA
jgi:predicted alpha/beta hydrolase